MLNDESGLDVRDLVCRQLQSIQGERAGLLGPRAREQEPPGRFKRHCGGEVRLGSPDQPEMRGSEEERRKDRRRSVEGLR